MKKNRISAVLLALGMLLPLSGKTVRASSFGFDPEDGTQALQKALDSGADKVIVDNPGKDWIVRPLFLRSDQEIIFEKGVTIRAKKGAFKGRTDCLFQGQNVSNIKLRGEGDVLFVMNKRDYDNPALYRHAEWRSAIGLFGVENITISGLHLKSSGGDGIYIGASKERRLSRNITVENVICEDHYRQGMSVICVRGLAVRNSKFIKTAGTAPQCGIDFEPNRPDQGFSDVLIENCEFSANKRAGIMFCLDLQKEPVSITVKNSLFKDNTTGFIVHSRNSGGELVLENCRVENNEQAACEIDGHSEKGLTIRLKNVTFDGRRAKDAAPIELIGGEADMGGIFFDNVKVLSSGNSVINFTGVTGYGLTGISGTVFRGREPGKLRKFDLARFVAARKPDPSLRMTDPPRKVSLKKLLPLSGKTVPAGTDYQLRNRFSFIQAVPDAGEWPVRFRGARLGKRPYELKCIVYDANGAVWDQFSVTEPDFTYKLKVKYAGGGVFRFAVATFGHLVSLIPAGSAQAVLTQDFVNLFCGKPRWYFVVPADAEYAAVMAKATAAEPADVQLLDASGKVVKEVKKIQSPVYIKVPRRKSPKDEIWSIRFPWVREDYAFRICPPSLPLAAPAPENLLTEKRETK